MQNQQKNKVFILNYIKDHNYNDAKRFGRLQIVTKGNVNIFDVGRLKLNIKDALNVMGFKSETDHLLISGGNIIGFALGLALSLLGVKRCNLLLWNAKECKYFNREVSI